MARRRFVMQGGELVEVPSDYAPPLRADSGALWGDRSYANLRASDGTPIDSRTKHRLYMKERGLTTMDDFAQHWERDAYEREARMRGVDASRKQDIADVLYGRRPMSKPRGREGDPL